MSYLHTLANSPPLQGGRGLAEHPLSCHPQRSVWQPRKRKENERKGRKEAAGKLPPSPCIADVKEVIDTKFLHTEAYIDAQCKGSYKKNQNRKAITGVKWKKTNSKSKQGIA